MAQTKKAEAAKVRRAERKREFVRALAEYLAGNQAGKSILLQMGGMAGEFAREWAKVRAASPLDGYPTVEEAEEILTAFLDG
jgi:hypothetical protein